MHYKERKKWRLRHLLHLMYLHFILLYPPAQAGTMSTVAPGAGKPGRNSQWFLWGNG
jgi:hypothetical protein